MECFVYQSQLIMVNEDPSKAASLLAACLQLACCMLAACLLHACCMLAACDIFAIRLVLELLLQTESVLSAVHVCIGQTRNNARCSMQKGKSQQFS